MSAKVSGHLPGGDGNGLQAITGDLVREPRKLHVAICILDGKSYTADADTGEIIPTARIRRIEVIAEEDDKRIAERLMRRALEARTGRETLPYDLEAEIAGAFAAVREEEEEEGRKGNGQ